MGSEPGTLEPSTGNSRIRNVGTQNPLAKSTEVQNKTVKGLQEAKFPNNKHNILWTKRHAVSPKKTQYYRGLNNKKRVLGYIKL